MPVTSIATVYTPITPAVIPINSDGKLVIIFSTQQPVYDSPKPCGKVIQLSCNTEGIEDMTDAVFVWKDCSSKFISDDNENVVVTLTPVPPDPITTVQIEIDESILSNRISYELYARIVIDAVESLVLLAKGIIYIPISVIAEFTQIPGNEW
jgi:hypothetical protein